MVDTLALGANTTWCESSSLSSGTINYKVMTYTVYHVCSNCEHSDELSLVNGLVQCPICDTVEDLWEDRVEVPEKHKILLDKQKRLKRLLRYGRDE